MSNNEGKSYDLVAVLAFVLGNLGVHRFYTGYIGIGVAQLLTLGGLGIWTLVDVVAICFNKYKDKNGNALAKFNPTLAFVMIILITLGLLISVILLAFVVFALLVLISVKCPELLK